MTISSRVWAPLLGIASGLAAATACTAGNPHVGPGTWALEGQHSAISCQSCHLDSFTELPSRCTSCHEDERPQSHIDDPERASKECSECHETFAWVLGEPDTGAPPVVLNCAAGCHGGEENPAPPGDVDGNIEESLVTVGAHQAHVTLGISCDECHIHVEAVDDLGHIDVGARDPADIEWGDVAIDQGDLEGDLPIWDRDLQTCSNTYCHGHTTALAEAEGNDPVPPVWTGGGGEAVCGNCHAIPSDFSHTPEVDTICDDCHPSNNEPTHSDGTVDRIF